MTHTRLRKYLCAGVIVALLCGGAPRARAELDPQDVLDAIEAGKAFLIKTQRKDGSWTDSPKELHTPGISALALLALLNSGMTADQEVIARGLKFLRNADEVMLTYDASSIIMALAAAKEGKRHQALLLSLVNKLERWQIKDGPDTGGWGYQGGGRADRSNSQFAILALREARLAGIWVNRATWELARHYWTSQQSPDGGFGYAGAGAPSSGSMTAAGISSLVIIDAMLRGADDENADGTPICCGTYPTDEALQRALAWFDQGDRFSVTANPGAGHLTLYYLYGIERAGRLGGRRYFGHKDWYREGTEVLLNLQIQPAGCWKGGGIMEDKPAVGTSLALLFLSKGMAPVLINKLKYGPRDPNRPDRVIDDRWNVHRRDIQNLAELISGLPQWPKLLTTQQVDIAAALAPNGIKELTQAPVLFINGPDAPGFSQPEIDLLREYVVQGGFIFAEAACTKSGFDRGFRELMEKMYPQAEYRLKRLPPDHPVFRSEFLIDGESTELWGVDLGCRTAVVYSPHDLACLWDKWAPYDPPEHSPQLKASIFKATRVGVNVIAYATGRNPSNKLEMQQLLDSGKEQAVERGFLQVAKLRHSGGWDSAPYAVKNLLTALNTYSGAATSTQQKNLAPTDPNLFKFPLVYMHGRNRFQFSREEQQQLLAYLQRGGVLFADACCGAPQFDAAFRDLMTQLFPNQKLKQIPPQHSLFSTTVGHDLHHVKRREPESTNSKQPLKPQIVEGDPYLEGIAINGRYAVIYSKYDISCALERQASAVCAGYLPDDAVKIAVNVVLYSLLQ